MQTIKEKYNKIVVPEMKDKFGYKNNMAIPKITSVVVGTGVGSLQDDKKKEVIENALTLITGQKFKYNKAKKSIATFKLREGMTIGYSVTMRGERMHDFLNRLINVVIPRIRDFRGLDTKIVDDMGNMTIGLKDHIVFPEVSDHDVREAFGLGVTIVTTAENKEEALEFFKLLGFPFKKD